MTRLSIGVLLVALFAVPVTAPLEAQQSSLPSGTIDLNPGSTPTYGGYVWFDWTLSRTGTWKNPIVQIYCEQQATGVITYSSMQYAEVQLRDGYHFNLVPTGPVDYAKETICFADLVVRRKDGPLWQGPLYKVDEVYFALR